MLTVLRLGRDVSKEHESRERSDVDSRSQRSGAWNEYGVRWLSSRSVNALGTFEQTLLMDEKTPNIDAHSMINLQVDVDVPVQQTLVNL